MTIITRPPSVRPNALLVQVPAMCVAAGSQAAYAVAYQYAWLRAQALLAEQARRESWGRFDPRWN